MRLSPKYHILLPKTPENVERLMADFDALYKIKELEYIKAQNGDARRTLKNGFGHLQSGADHELTNANTLRTKMMFIPF